MPLIRPCCLALLAAAFGISGCARNTPPEAAEPSAAPAVTSSPASPAVATPTPDTAGTLVAYRWQLESASDASGQAIAAFFPADHPLGVEFVDGRLGVTGGCNRLSVGYQLLDATRMQLGQGVSTMMACLPPLADADAAFARFLTGTLQVTVDGAAGAPRLRLAAADGSNLNFSGTPTPETRFGGAGTRAFLEVSTEPCVAPAPSTPPCLMVRDRHFDENGLASGSPGEWRPLPEGIEGYTPVAGQQHVVRVKRFEQAGTGGGAPTVHFVLDLIIETRTVGS